MPSEKRACARAKRYLSALLCEAQEQDWAESSAEEIENFLSDAKTTEVLSCSCSRCVDGRTHSSIAQANSDTTFWATRMDGSKRLFATCIIADMPYLIYQFLHHDFDDNRFDECIAPTTLRDVAGLSLQDARSLLDEKEKFFDGGRISLFTYMRSLRPGREPPVTEEANWIIDEFLTLSDKLALEPDACARKIPPNTTVKDLMIRDSPARPLNREAQSTDGLGEQIICMQSLGYLALDLICFIAGGGSFVKSLDERRSSGVDLLNETNWTPLDEIENFNKIFQLVQIMACPNEEFGVSKDGHGKDNFKHISQQFHRIWPRHTHEHSHADSEKERNSDETSLSSQGLGNPVACPYEEIEPDAFRSMHVRYQREGHQQRKCKLRVFRSTDGESIRLDLLSFDRDALNPSSYYAAPKDLCFVPLYAHNAYTELNEFGARFQLATESSASLTIPYIFRFQSAEDVKIFQTSVTSRIIEKDVAVSDISLILRKKKRLIGSGSPKSCQFKVGRLQLWRVLDKRALKDVHETASLAVHGLKHYPLRAEMVILSGHAVIVIGIKSVLRLKDLPDSGLRIETKEKAPKASLEGRRICSDDTKCPGLPLFQSQSFNSQEGDGVICDSIELKFATKEARDDLSSFIEERYNKPPSPARS